MNHVVKAIRLTLLLGAVGLVGMGFFPATSAAQQTTCADKGCVGTHYNCGFIIVNGQVIRCQQDIIQ